MYPIPFERLEWRSRISLIDFTYTMNSRESRDSSGLLKVVTKPLLIYLDLEIRNKHSSNITSQRLLYNEKTTVSLPHCPPPFLYAYANYFFDGGLDFYFCLDHDGYENDLDAYESRDCRFDFCYVFYDSGDAMNYGPSLSNRLFSNHGFYP